MLRVCTVTLYAGIRFIEAAHVLAGQRLVVKSGISSFVPVGTRRRNVIIIPTQSANKFDFVNTIAGVRVRVDLLAIRSSERIDIDAETNFC